MATAKKPVAKKIETKKPVAKAKKPGEKVAKPAPKKEAPKKEAPQAAPKKDAKPAPKAAPKAAPKKNTSSYHLSKRASDNKWQVFRAGSDKVIKLFDTKAEAEAYTKQMAENQGVTYLPHASKGKNKGKIHKK